VIEAARVGVEALGWGLIHLAWQVAVLVAMLRLADAAAVHAAPATRYRVTLWTLLSVPALLVATLLLLAGAGAGHPGAEADMMEVATSAPLFTVTPADAVRRLTLAAPYLGAVWAVWALLALVRWSGGLWLLGRLASVGSRPAAAEHARLVEAGRRRMGIGRPVRLRVCGAVDSPTVVGLRRPTILLSDTLPQSFGCHDIDAVLAHELAHVLRGDHRHKAVQALVRSVLCFHPGMIWMSNRLDVQREQACDEIAAAVLDDRRGYAASLARLEILRATRSALAPAAHGAGLIDRVRRLAAPPPTGITAMARCRLAAVILACALVLSAGAAAGLPATAREIERAAHAATVVTITATDPAGEFTLSLRAGRAIGASVAHQPLRAGQLRQRKSEVTLIPAPPLRPFVVQIVPGGIRWDARSPGAS
jgi:beta-lactamase regulating signal transducer with metallopeptidase domain